MAALCLVAALTASGTAVGELEAAAPHTTLLALLPRAAGDPVRSEAFLLALSLQLDLHAMAMRETRWSPPPTLAAQQRVAARYAVSARAGAVVWWVATGAPAQITIYLLDRRELVERLRAIPMGQASEGVERSMATAVRTLVVAQTLHGAPRPPAAPRTTAGAERPLGDGDVAAGDRPQPLLWIGAGYALETFPVGADLRHGPQVTVGLEPWRRFEARLGLGYRLSPEGTDSTAAWSRRFYRLSLEVGARWLVSRRFTLLAGGAVALSAVNAEARATTGAARNEHAWLWELSLGVTGGAALHLGARASLELRLLLAWLPLGHALMVRGSEVVRSGGLEVALCPTFVVGFL